MSVRPIDFQLSIPRANDASKIQQQNNDRANLNHQQASSTIKNQVEHNLKVVTETGQSYKVNAKKDEEEKKKKKDKGKKEDKQNKKPSFDMSV